MSDQSSDSRRAVIANVLRDALGRTVTIYAGNGTRVYHGELKAVEDDYIVVDQNGAENNIVLSALVSFVVTDTPEVSEIYLPQ